MAKNIDLKAEKEKDLDLCIMIAATARGKGGRLDISDVNYIIREATRIVDICLKKEDIIK